MFTSHGINTNVASGLQAVVRPNANNTRFIRKIGPCGPLQICHAVLCGFTKPDVLELTGVPEDFLTAFRIPLQAQLCGCNSSTQ